MIAVVGKGATKINVAKLAMYCISPKKGDDLHEPDERLLAFETGGECGALFIEQDKKSRMKYADTIAKQFLEFTKTARNGKDMPKDLVFTGVFSWDESDDLTDEQALAHSNSMLDNIYGHDENQPRALFVHGNTRQKHVHFIQPTTMSNGTIWQYKDPANENTNARSNVYRAFEKECERVEIENNYVRVFTRKAFENENPERAIQHKAKSHGLVRAQMREKESSKPVLTSPHEYLKEKLREAYTSSNTCEQFISSLYSNKVETKIHANNIGLQFKLASDEQWTNGSKLGKKYSYENVKAKIYGQEQIDRPGESTSDDFKRAYNNAIKSCRETAPSIGALSIRDDLADANLEFKGLGNEYGTQELQQEYNAVETTNIESKTTSIESGAIRPHKPNNIDIRSGDIVPGVHASAGPYDGPTDIRTDTTNTSTNSSTAAAAINTTNRAGNTTETENQKIENEAIQRIAARGNMSFEAARKMYLYEQQRRIKDKLAMSESETWTPDKTLNKRLLETNKTQDIADVIRGREPEQQTIVSLSNTAINIKPTDGTGTGTDSPPM